MKTFIVSEQSSGYDSREIEAKDLQDAVNKAFSYYDAWTEVYVSEWKPAGFRKVTKVEAVPVLPEMEGPNEG